MSTPRPARLWPALLRAWDTSGITVPALLWLLPGMTITDANLTDPSLPLLTRITIGLAGWLALAGVLLVANRVVVMRLHGTRRRVAVLCVYAVGATARVLIVAGLVGALPPTGGTSLSWVPVRWASTLIWLNASAIVMSWQRRSARAVAQLEAERQRADATYERLAEEYARTQQLLSAARTSVRSTITSVIDELASPIDREQATRVAGSLRRAVDDLVRPTSHELAQAPLPTRQAVSPALVAQRFREQVRGIIRVWPTAGPFQWWATFAFSVPIAIAAVLSHPDQRTTGILVLGLLAQMGVLAAAAAVLPQHLTRMRWHAGVAVVAGTYTLMLAIGFVFGNMALGANDRPALEVWVLPTLVAMLTGGAIAFDVNARLAEQAAQDVIAELEWQIGRTHQQLWAERRRLAITLHGQVQAALTACVALIEQWLDGAVRLSPAALTERLDTTLRQAVELDAPHTAQHTFESSVDELISTWAGVVEIEASISDAAHDMLASDPDGCYAATEAVRELVLNSVRHAGSTKACVLVHRTSDRVVQIDITTDAVTAGVADRRHSAAETNRYIDERTDRRQQDHGTTGIGLSLLDSIALSWQTQVRDGQRETAVQIATHPTDARRRSTSAGPRRTS